MIAVALALAAAFGTYLVYTSVALGWRGWAPNAASLAGRRRLRDRLDEWLVQAGLDETRPSEIAGVLVLLFAVGAVGAWMVFPGALPPLAGGLFAGSFPVAVARSRREQRRASAREAWPRLIEEIRIKTASLGRSIPQAVIEVGQTAPASMRPAFEAARREWLISTDFERSLAILKVRLADATADTVCETLLVAHEVGGNDLDRCLTALIEDRIMDVQGRKDTRSRQAGARFTRRFVIAVPIVMALVGLRIGDGRAAYATPSGQLLVVVGLAMMALCWVWAGRILRLPDEHRVFGESTKVSLGSGS
jgi:tight adherence protein B